LQPSAASLLKKSWVKVSDMAKTIKVQLVKGLIGTRETHRATVRGLGLRGINSVRELEDTPAVRGMINKVAYLVKVVS
jgi:large subunit ribosomal protein L30